MKPRTDRVFDSPELPENGQLGRRWRDLVERYLPEAAAKPGVDWPVRLNHCFARILLDNAAGRPWREVIPPPAWCNADAGLLLRAIALGEAVLQGKACLHDLNTKSLQLRGKHKAVSRSA